MTPEQIRQIAEEYAHSIFDVDKSGPNLNEKAWQEQFDMATKVMRETLEFLTERYCVVERNRICELYECYSQHIKASHKIGLTHAEDIAKGSCIAMVEIFGSETFNKKEDD